MAARNASAWLSLNTNTLVFCGSLLVLSFLSTSFAQKRNEQELPELDIKLGKTTTRITGPLDAKGRIDYVTALDKLARKGVTRERNLARAIWKAVGNARMSADPNYRDKFEKKLEYDFSGSAPRLTSLSDFLVEIGRESGDTSNKLYEEYESLCKKPWVDDDSPKFAKLLKKNKIALDRFTVAAAKCDQFYSPYVITKNEDLPNTLAVKLPTLQEARVIAQLLTLRVAHGLGAKDVTGVHRDLVALKRLARAYSQAPTIIELLVCYSFERLAIEHELRIIKMSFFDDPTSKAYLRDIQALHPVPEMHRPLDLSERFMALDTTLSIAEKGFRQLQLINEIEDNRKRAFVDEIAKNFLKVSVDWNEALIAMNKSYDEIVAISKIRPAERRAKAIASFEERMDTRFQQLKNPALIALSLLGGNAKKALGRRTATMLTAMLTPALKAALQAETEVTSHSRAAMVRMATRAYERKHGRSPKSLDDLVPEYLQSIPIDNYTDKPYANADEKTLRLPSKKR